MSSPSLRPTRSCCNLLHNQSQNRRPVNNTTSSPTTGVCSRLHSSISFGQKTTRQQGKNIPMSDLNIHTRAHTCTSQEIPQKQLQGNYISLSFISGKGGRDQQEEKVDSSIGHPESVTTVQTLKRLSIFQFRHQSRPAPIYRQHVVENKRSGSLTLQVSAKRPPVSSPPNNQHEWKLGQTFMQVKPEMFPCVDSGRSSSFIQVPHYDMSTWVVD